MRPLVSLFVAFIMVLSVSSAPALANTEADPYVTDLIAGQSIDAGNVLVWNDEAKLYIKYVAEGGWCITETHLHVGLALVDIPQTKKGNPKPGRFEYKDRFDPCASEALYTVPLVLDPGTQVYIAAHAVVKNGSKKESAWGAGIGFPWKNWATYFKYPQVPSIEIEKWTNGEDADTPPGPSIPVGGKVTWTYLVTNTGGVPLTGVTVTDDQMMDPVTCPETTLDPGESMTCTVEGNAGEGPYANVGTATGNPPTGPAVEDTDPSHYVGIKNEPAIAIKKFTNGQDANDPPGPTIAVGETVTWTYVVTNTGNVPLASVTVTDNQVVAVTCPKAALASGESMTCQATGDATEGQYSNIGTARGTPLGGSEISSQDPSHYMGEVAAITIEEVSASPNVLWPPNHKMVPVTVSVTFTGNGTPPTCQVTSVTSNEPENGLGDGDMFPDSEITGPLTLILRAERAGNGTGRIYTITVECSDGSDGSVEVTVPLNKGKKK